MIFELLKVAYSHLWTLVMILTVVIVIYRAFIKGPRCPKCRSRLIVDRSLEQTGPTTNINGTFPPNTRCPIGGCEMGEQKVALPPEKAPAQN